MPQDFPSPTGAPLKPSPLLELVLKLVKLRPVEAKRKKMVNIGMGMTAPQSLPQTMEDIPVGGYLLEFL